MTSDSDAPERIDVAEHVVATSETEDPKETVARLFGEREPQDSARAQETVAKLFGRHDDRQESRRIQETMANLLDDDSGESEGDSFEGDDIDCGTVDELRPDEETRHELRFDDRVEYAHCVDGALIAAELTDSERVVVRSFDPVSGKPVNFDTADGGREVTPPDAVVSMGMAEAAADSENMVDFGVGMATGEKDPGAYVEDPLDVFCRNCNAFENRESYRRWAADADAVSVAVPADVFAEMIRDLVSSSAFD